MGAEGYRTDELVSSTHPLYTPLIPHTHMYWIFDTYDAYYVHIML